MKAMDEDILQVLVTEEQLKAKVQQLGEQISRDYEGKDLLLVSILKGSVVFMADIMRAIKIPSAIAFMVVSRCFLLQESYFVTPFSFSAAISSAL